MNDAGKPVSQGGCSVAARTALSGADTAKNTARHAPPFRADVVGSFLRPERLKAARARLLGPQTPDQHLGPHDNAELRSIEDDCVREVIAMQERAGLKAVTDGEFRRRSWWLDLIMGWDGFSANRTGSTDVTWRNAGGPTQAFSRLWTRGPIRWRESATARAFAFLKDSTSLVAKVTLPAPNQIHFMCGGDNGIREGHYKDVEAFWEDLILAYRQELDALMALGATYIQFDDTSIAFLCDPQHRETVRRWGSEPDKLLEEYARRINAVLEHVADSVTVTLHQCRGNREGNWGAEGGYDPVAVVLFNQIDVGGYFLEYDTSRAGGFAPLRFLPKGKTAVLGIMSSKSPDLESVDFLRRRVDEAAAYVSRDQLALSPQCGFASSIAGNPMSESEQEAKLARLVEAAATVWGED
jgi:5-methyltetrahydropteroyltriglutamate--homocysteine methyltransferase